MNQSMMDNFWKFVAERQEIYHKRFVLNLPKPWTSDKILQRYKFTNVYRELDKGTLFLTENILPMCQTDENILWQIILYRIFNKIETFTLLLNLVKYEEFDAKKVIDLLKEYDKAGNPIFTSAYMMTGVKFFGKPKKYENYVLVLDELHKKIPFLLDKIKKAERPIIINELLASQTGIADFLAYEIYSDILYTSLTKFTEDYFVNPGPGLTK